MSGSPQRQKGRRVRNARGGSNSLEASAHRASARRQPSSNQGRSVMNRKRQRSQNSGSRTPANRSTTADSIQAQLERQRQQTRQQQQEATAPKANDPVSSSPKPAILGNFRYDPQRQAYFPESHFRDASHQESTKFDNNNDDESRVRSAQYRTFPYLFPLYHNTTVPKQKHPSSFDWLFARQACWVPQIRTRLTAFGISRSQLEGLRFTPAACRWPNPSGSSSSSSSSSQPNHRWSLLFGDAAGQDAVTSWNDITCKIHRPSWLQTFDVWTPPPTTTPQAADHKLDLQLQVATIVENGYDIRSNYSRRAGGGREHACRKLRHYQPFQLSHPQLVKYMEFPSLQNGGPGISLMFLDSEEGRSSLSICSPPVPHIDDNDTSDHSNGDIDDAGAFWLDTQLDFPVPANDMVSDGACGFLLAAARGQPWHFDHHHMTTGRLSIRNLIRSEILCLDRLGEKNRHYCFGHRKGSVTLYDQRSPQTSQVLGATTDNDTSSIVRIQASNGAPNDELANMREHMILVRKKALHDNQVCAVWDVRHGSKPIFQLTLPSRANANVRYTQRCNGMATDPHGTTLFAPFVRDHDNDGHGAGGEYPCLGVWSLLTGEWIGHRELAQPPSDEDIPLSSSSTVSWVELCSRRTTAWERRPQMQEHLRDETEITNDHYPDTDSLGQVPGSFGLWYKCGHSPAGHQYAGHMPPQMAGNIHHIVI